jgi:hypothetical protein
VLTQNTADADPLHLMLHAENGGPDEPQSRGLAGGFCGVASHPQIDHVHPARAKHPHRDVTSSCERECQKLAPQLRIVLARLA